MWSGFWANTIWAIRPWLRYKGITTLDIVIGFMLLWVVFGILVVRS